jgi:hypothetical protein
MKPQDFHCRTPKRATSNCQVGKRSEVGPFRVSVEKLKNVEQDFLEFKRTMHCLDVDWISARLW